MFLRPSLCIFLTAIFAVLARLPSSVQAEADGTLRSGACPVRIGLEDYYPLCTHLRDEIFRVRQQPDSDAPVLPVMSSAAQLTIYNLGVIAVNRPSDPTAPAGDDRTTKAFCWRTLAAQACAMHFDSDCATGYELTHTAMSYLAVTLHLLLNEYCSDHENANDYIARDNGLFFD